MINLKLVPVVDEVKDLNLRLVGIFAKNREEWVVQDVVNFLYGFSMVPLYDTLGPENISYCIAHSGMRTIVASAPSVDTLLKT
jgi:long-chain acyl-CoA synthetase